MYKIEVPNRINQMMSVLHAYLWQDRSWFLKVINFSACIYYPIGIFGASILSDNKMESIFMGILLIAVLVEVSRICLFFWKKDQIIELVRTLGTHIIRNKVLQQLHLDVDSKIKRFVAFASLLPLLIMFEIPIVTITALIPKEKHLLLNLYFPLNWKESEIVYWFAFAYTTYTVSMFWVFTGLNVIVWYLMLCCAIKYEILANELKFMGADSTEETLLKKQRMFAEDLIELIKNHQQMQDLTETLKTTFANLFFIQFITSGINICGAVFTLAFIPLENPSVFVFYFVLIVYFVFEIFMVTYIANEIKLWSSRLSNSLFECDWLDQSKTCKKCMIILMEVLKRPKVLMIGKLYAIDLEIFTNILNFTYSMFNVLLRFK